MIAVGAQGSVADLKQRGFLPETFPAKWPYGCHQVHTEALRKAQQLQTSFDNVEVSDG